MNQILTHHLTILPLVYLTVRSMNQNICFICKGNLDGLSIFSGTKKNLDLRLGEKIVKVHFTQRGYALNLLRTSVQ